MHRDGSLRRKRVLVLVYAFPPANHVASMRGVRIGCAFTKRGWDVHVLKSDFHPSQCDLQLDVSEFLVHTYRSRPLSRLLAQAPAERSAKSLLLSLGRRIVPPDPSWLMWNAINRAIDELGGLSQFDCVVSSAFPFVLHDICARRRERGERFFWVADTRDMWAGSAYRRGYAVPVAYLRRVEARTFATCDVATFASETTARIYAQRYGIETQVVLNGVEGSAPPSGLKTRGPLRRFVHAGALYGGHRDLSPLTQALDMLSRADGQTRELLLAGVDSVPVAKRLAASAAVKVQGLGPLSRSAATDLQDGADALVLASADTDFDASYTPAKLFEYAFRGKPIIATAREASDVGRLVERHSLGVASFDPAKIAAFIRSAERGEWPGAGSLDELTSDRQFGRLAEVVEERVRARVSR